MGSLCVIDLCSVRLFYISLTVMSFLSSYSKIFREDHRPENVLVHCSQINSLKKVNPDVLECLIRNAGVLCFGSNVK